ncbi:hypothetical protein K438DRAFT_1755150 [Mycena galopus ATCC 62051]|nr:hypothetical protein K438DRAFT_1755150 [Mycena galopus ATCC 62051]
MDLQENRYHVADEARGPMLLRPVPRCTSVTARLAGGCQPLARSHTCARHIGRVPLATHNVPQARPALPAVSARILRGFCTSSWRRCTRRALAKCSELLPSLAVAPATCTCGECLPSTWRSSRTPATYAERVVSRRLPASRELPQLVAEDPGELSQCDESAGIFLGWPASAAPQILGVRAGGPGAAGTGGGNGGQQTTAPYSGRAQAGETIGAARAQRGAGYHADGGRNGGGRRAHVQHEVNVRGNRLGARNAHGAKREGAQYVAGGRGSKRQARGSKRQARGSKRSIQDHGMGAEARGNFRGGHGRRASTILTHGADKLAEAGEAQGYQQGGNRNSNSGFTSCKFGQCQSEYRRFLRPNFRTPEDQLLWKGLLRLEVHQGIATVYSTYDNGLAEGEGIAKGREQRAAKGSWVTVPLLEWQWRRIERHQLRRRRGPAVGAPIGRSAMRWERKMSRIKRDGVPVVGRGMGVGWARDGPLCDAHGVSAQGQVWTSLATWARFDRNSIMPLFR